MTEKHTPMMEQYLAIKSKHPDKILFFQVGDFYEMFYDDARVAARELDLILTTREVGKENPVPLAGIPMHAAPGYTARLLEKGYKVVICDQVEDASIAKGLVKREVTRIITPGTVTDQSMLEETRNNYLVSLVKEKGAEGFGLALTDISTGGFWVTVLRGENAFSMLKGEWQRIQPAECIYPREMASKGERDRIFGPCLQVSNRVLLEELEDGYFAYERAAGEVAGQWGEERLQRLKSDGCTLAVRACGSLLAYVKELYQKSLKHLRPVEMYFAGEYLILDGVTRRNLELVQTIREGKKKGSLLEVLDHTCSSMGGRLMKRWIEQPLKEVRRIKARSAAVEELCQNSTLKEELRSYLKQARDLERICGRLNFGNVNARDLVALRKTLELLPEIKSTLLESATATLLKSTAASLPLFDELVRLLKDSLVEDPPLSLKEGGLIKEGYNREVDSLRKIGRDGKNWLLELEHKERERTGIKSIKVGYNRVFGYYLEVTRSNLHLVPPEYHRKQTLVNAERYITEELKQMEEQITGAGQKLVQLEYDLLEEIRQRALNYAAEMQKASQLAAELDCLQSLGQAALLNRYCRPDLSEESRVLEIKEGRHPVVEKSDLKERFVPNDVFMSEEERIIILTGPNMAGKSTYCRGVALSCLMAQMGGFVPAREARLPVLDRIFARVGASDDLSSGQSTFMVEMNETASILQEATSRTLVLLDEIGRGTSTYDGMSIARSVLEYLHQHIGAWTLFSTHYHELTVLEEELPGVRNYTVAVKERGSSVVFLRRVVPGKADKSYGINVARLAGLPPQVIERAETILKQAENQRRPAGPEGGVRQLSFIDLGSHSRERERRAGEAGCSGEAEEILREIRSLDPDTVTPLEALQKLYRLRQKLGTTGEKGACRD